METKKLIFTDRKSSETVLVIEKAEEITNFLETFRIEVGEVIELSDAMYTVKAVSEKQMDGGKEIAADVEFMDLIENQPTA